MQSFFFNYDTYHNGGSVQGRSHGGNEGVIFSLEYVASFGSNAVLIVMTKESRKIEPVTMCILLWSLNIEN